MDKRERVARAISKTRQGVTPAPVPHAKDYRMADAAIAALEPMDKPRIKPLVWTQKGYAETPFGKYHVVMEDWSGQDDFWFVCFAGKPYGKCGEHGSEEAAKAAAQADYEARILAALEPVTVQKAARVLIPWFERQHYNWAVSKGRNPEDYTSHHLFAADALRALAAKDT